MTDKQALRKQMRALPKAAPQESAAIVAGLLGLAAYQSAKRVFAFYPMAGEPDILPFLRAVLESGRELYLPQSAPGGRMLPLRVVRLDALHPGGSFGIPEPDESAERCLDPDFTVVPAAAYDRECYRLGRGGGYYDRFLAGYRGVSAGVCFRAALLTRVPREEHDKPVEMVVTPDEILDRRGQTHG